MKLFSKVPKKLVAALVVVAAMAGIGASVIAGFGPDRPTMQWTAASNGFDHVTFNSFVGVPNGIGDERDFFRGVQVGRDGNWIDPVNSVNDTAEIEGKIYIHNNADTTLNDAAGNPGIARNTVVRVSIPTGSAQAQDVTSYISADNASPLQIFDTLSLTGANSGYFELAYVPGSATITDQSGAVSPVSDSLVTTGASIGDQRGCFQYVREIRFRMKVKMPNYSISKEVQIIGQDTWSENVNAQTSDTLGWIITFNNIGNTSLNHVKVVDNVPAGLTVVPGSVKLTNGNYPNGTVVPDSAIQANGRQINVDIGNYDPGILAYVTFRTVFDVNTLACGVNTIQNEAFTTPEGYGAIRDVATATVTRTNCQPTVVKRCTGLNASLANVMVNQPDTFTAGAEVQNATVSGYNFVAKNAQGAVVDSFGVATTNTSAAWTKSFTQAGTYTVSVVINTDQGQAEGVCEATVTVSGNPVIVKRCDSLIAYMDQVYLGDFVTFEANATVENTTITSYVFTTKNAAGQVVDTQTHPVGNNDFANMYDFTATVAGTYKTSVVVNTAAGVAEGTCEATVTFQDIPVEPIYACTNVMIDLLGNRKIRATAQTTATPADRVSVVNYEFTYGDGSTPFSTNNHIAEYTYAKDGTYRVSVRVTFAVDGVNQTVSSESCAKTITITTEEKCEFNPNLPKGDSKCRPKCQYDAKLLDNDAKCKPVTTIPNTGAGSTIGIFILSAMLGMFIYRFGALRRQ